MENNVTAVQKGIFGPIASILTFSDEDDLIERANDTDFGLAAGIWTEDFRKAKRIADTLEAGTIWINESRLAGGGGADTRLAGGVIYMTQSI